MQVEVVPVCFGGTTTSAESDVGRFFTLVYGDSSE